MTTTITSYSDLLKTLSQLPPPKPDTIRVYRGQTVDYPQLSPSGLRRPVRNEAIWHVYAQHLHTDLLPQAIEKTGDVTEELLQAIGVWLHAVCQHYGPGSDFLDVTHSIDVALWFALHETNMARAQGSIGPPGPPNPATDHPTEMELVRYRPWAKPGYLYVFDLPKWDGEGLPAPGAVVDVAAAPEVFSSSARMRIQQACLVQCRNQDSTLFDLRRLLVEGTPLTVARPMSDAPGLSRQVADIFPSPEKDPWYARLLSVPMTYAPRPLPPRLRRPIPVTVYLDEHNSTYTQEVHFRDVTLPLPLLHRAFEDFNRPTAVSADRQPFPNAVPIILEAPLIFPYPPGDSEMWHHGLLSKDIPSQCAVYDFESAAPCGEIPLTNVLFEFSFLEHTGWDRIVKTNERIKLLRGVWLRQDGDTLGVALVYHEVPGVRPEVLGFLPLHFNAGTGQFAFYAPGKEQSDVSITDDPVIAKAILCALMLLRSLSPAFKVNATPSLHMSTEAEGKASHQSLFRCGRESARLFRVPAPAPLNDWFVLRDAGNPDEPFTHAANAPAMIEVTHSTCIRDIPLAMLERELQKIRDAQ